MQTDLQAVYIEIRKGSVHSVNEDRMYAMHPNKILLTIADSVSDTFRYSVVHPLVPIHTNIKDYKSI